MRTTYTTAAAGGLAQGCPASYSYPCCPPQTGYRAGGYYPASGPYYYPQQAQQVVYVQEERSSGVGPGGAAALGAGAGFLGGVLLADAMRPDHYAYGGTTIIGGRLTLQNCACLAAAVQAAVAAGSCSNQGLHLVFECTAPFLPRCCSEPPLAPCVPRSSCTADNSTTVIEAGPAYGETVVVDNGGWGGDTVVVDNGGWGGGDVIASSGGWGGDAVIIDNGF